MWTSVEYNLLCMVCSSRLEDINEKRQAMVQKLKGVEKELQGLEGRKLEAEAYIGKQVERLKCNILGHSIDRHKAEVCSLLGVHASRVAKGHALQQYSDSGAGNQQPVGLLSVYGTTQRRWCRVSNIPILIA